MSGVFGRIPFEVDGAPLRPFEEQLKRFDHIYEGGTVVRLDAGNADLVIVHNGFEHWQHQTDAGILDVYGSIDPSALSTSAWDELIRQPAARLPHVDGSFLVVIRREGGQLEVWTDASGSIPLYWTTHRNALEFGTENAFMLDGDAPSKRIDPVALASRLLLRVASFEHSVWTGIQLLPVRAGLVGRPGHPHRIERWEPARHPLTWRTKEEYAQIFLDCFRQSLRRELRRSAGRSVGLYLSAGLDSRFIASCLVEMGEQPHALTYETGTLEVPLGRRVAKRLCLQQTIFPIDFDFLPEGGWEYLRTSSAELNMLYGHVIPLSKRVSALFPYMWDGVMGDQLFPKDQLKWFKSMPASMSRERAVDFFLSTLPETTPDELARLHADARFAAGFEQFRSAFTNCFADAGERNWLISYLRFQREHGSIRRRNLLGAHNQRNVLSLCCPFLSSALDQLAMSYVERHDDHLEMYSRIVGLVNREMLWIPMNDRGRPGDTHSWQIFLSRLVQFGLRRVSPYGRSMSFRRRYVREFHGPLRPALDDALRESRLSDAGLLEGDTVRALLLSLRDGRTDDCSYLAAQIFTLEKAIRLLEARVSPGRA